MADLINIGTSALLSYQTALNTTSNNIANVNTEGYTRQRTNFEALSSTFTGGFFFGNGVEVGSIQRIYDQFLTADVLNRSSSFGSSEAYHSYASRLDSLFGNSGSNLQSSMDAFYSAVQDVANNPSGLPERQALLGQAGGLVDQFTSLGGALENVNQEISSRVQVEVDEINALSAQIAEINDEISSTGSRAIPSQLLDQRELLVKEMASKLSIQTLEQADGTINVSLANGTSLVSSSLSNNLTTFRNEYDPFRMEIGYSGRAGDVAITDDIVGGSLGGALQFREELLVPTQNQLGLIGATITTAFNQQQQLGMDLDGNIGQEFFSSFNLRSVSSSFNTGSATVTVDLADIGQLTADDYELRFDGVDWRLTNLTTNDSQTGAGPFTVNGVTVSIAGTAATGDSYLIQPSRDAQQQFSLAMADPRGIAAAAAVRSEQPISNLGTSAVSDLRVTDATTIPLASDVTLTFNPDALGAGVPGFDVTGIAGGPLAYDPGTQSGGTTLTLAGFEFTVSGTPESGDSLGIVNNVGGTGDNTNALLLADLQNGNSLLNGTSSQQDLYSAMVADVGIKTARAGASMETEAVLLNQAEQSVESIGGVNLDEEAADLIRFQQAYQAAAQIVSVADTLFNTLLSATGR